MWVSKGGEQLCVLCDDNQQKRSFSCCSIADGMLRLSKGGFLDLSGSGGRPTCSITFVCKMHADEIEFNNTPLEFKPVKLVMSVHSLPHMRAHAHVYGCVCLPLSGPLLQVRS